jgi:hypothetical protein
MFDQNEIELQARISSSLQRVLAQKEDLMNHLNFEIQQLQREILRLREKSS